MDRPGGHGLGARLVLGDDRLEHDECEPGSRVVFELSRVERQLTRAFPDRVRDPFTEVAAGQIDSVR